ncbi:vitellogenin-2 isoform X1 [Cucumis melo var. makuwa]|uniref:Vitellogenin-2 isoform X1 n=1 Tax=Cucumis melo var. makuwa TaxID=1194695 RepID=A0A5A7U9W2_CUCMM|nr:vitellogenin-2 isoform X1 [Cucumis melo var. makuwa]TYK04532.1 vitellogenin-2 isoform X1 [Cucumis melo var. makuwa]
MESHKRNLRARKPLADCTNTILSSQSPASNFSASIKPRKRVSKSAVKDVANNQKKGEPVLASESTSVNLRASNPSSEFLPPEPTSDVPPAEPNPSFDSFPSEPSSSRFPTEFSTPPRPADLPSSSGTDGVSEPQTVYSRRHPSNKRKSVEKALEPFILYTASKIQNGGRIRDDNNSPSKARTVPCNKRQRASLHEEDDSNLELPREFVEQQKTYFSEVDAFELPVEEAKSSDSE